MTHLGRRSVLIGLGASWLIAPQGLAMRAPYAPECAPRILTPGGAPLPRTGFALVLASGGGARALTLVRGRRIRVELVAVELAPGLFRMEATPRPGTYRLEGVEVPFDIVIGGRVARPAPAPAPVLVAANRVEQTRVGSTEVRRALHLALRDPANPGTVALRAEIDGGVRWVPMSPGERTVEIPVADACSGARTAFVSREVRVELIDSLGQRSASSELRSIE